MALVIDGVCISSVKGSVLYWTSLLGDLDLSSLENLVALALQSDDFRVKDRPGVFCLRRGGCLWLMTTLGVDSEDWRTYTQTSARCGRGASTGRDVCLTNGQKLSLVKALEWLHCAVTTALTNGSTAPEDSLCALVAQNLPLVQQVVLAMAPCGVLHLRPLQQLLSETSLRRKPEPKPDLFGLVASESVLSDAPAQSLRVDVVERLAAPALLTLGQLGAGGLTCLGNLSIHTPPSALNSALSLVIHPNPSALQGSGGVRTTALGAGVRMLGGQLQLGAVTAPRVCLLQYEAKASLPFALSCRPQPIAYSNNDCSLVLLLRGAYPPQCHAPRVSLSLPLPRACSALTSRTVGHRHQTLVKSSREPDGCPLLVWTVEHLPGDGEAKAFVRIVGGGATASFPEATLDFEVSQWLSSGLELSDLQMAPPLQSQPLVRSLSVGNGIRINMSDCS